ncbi:MAG: YqeG family HAD IIIA-type phosphatase [bacterium]|nr:YqeG family HAD IIIA-type phosphatase [bacterium]
MNKFIPNDYKKNIFDINYEQLKKNNIKCLVFDLDNTIGLIDEMIISENSLNLLNKLKNDFIVVIISNNTSKRISKFCSEDIEYVTFAMKPLPKGFNKIKKKYNLKNNEMCIIGDQLMTDIIGANMFGAYSILVDPLGEKDLKITAINRYIENKIIKKLSKKNILERGKYYE